MKVYVLDGSRQCTYLYYTTDINQLQYVYICGVGHVPIVLVDTDALPFCARCSQSANVAVMDVSISHGNPQDSESYAQLLADVFETDPLVVAQAGLNAHGGLNAQFSALLDAVYFDIGAVDIARVDGELAGVALWMKPRTLRADTIAKKLKQAGKLIGHIPHIAKNLPPISQLPTLIISAVKMFEASPRIPHWHLMEIGVSERFRGHAIGRRLLEHGLARVDQTQAPAYLEASSERVAKLYASYDFGLLQTITVGKATAYSMLRPVQTLSTGS